MTKTLYLLPIALGLIATAPTAHADLIAVYHLGENDPGAAAGNVVNPTTVDSGGGVDLTRFGSPTYSNNHDPGGSTLSMQFNGATDYFLGPVVTNITDNFELQAWVDPTGDVNNGAVIAANGHTGVSGFGLVMGGGEYFGIFGGVDVFDAGPVTLGQWTLLTLIDVNGTVQMFQNNVLITTAFDTPNAIPNPSFPADPVNMQIGGTVNGDQLFTGYIDDVLVSSVPEPSTFVLLASVLLTLGGGFATRRKRQTSSC